MTGVSTLVAAAMAAAADTMGYGAARLSESEQRGDGRGKVRALAGAAIVERGWTQREAGPLVKVNSVQLYVSALIRAGITADHVRAVTALLDAQGAMTKSRPLRRNDTGWIDPRRDLEREAKIVSDRESGIGPADLAAKYDLGLTAIHSILTRSGKQFAPLLRGPRPGRANPTPGAKAAKLIPPEARKKPAPRLKSVKAPTAPPPPMRPPEAIEAFPDDHPTWAPLEGTTPCLLIHHEKGCRWPVTVQGSTGPMVCNQPKHGATPYCEPHAWLGASPAIRATMVRPSTALPAPRIARPLTDCELQSA